MSDPARLDEARVLLGALAAAGSAATVDAQVRRVMVPVSGGPAVLMDGLRQLDAAGIAVDDVGLRRPTLDDVFLTLTGHEADAGDQKVQTP